MIKRIAELAKEAGIDPATNSVGMPILVATKDGKLADPKDALETFAKLIVNECVTIADTTIIKQTFGITE